MLIQPALVIAMWCTVSEGERERETRRKDNQESVRLRGKEGK